MNEPEVYRAMSSLISLAGIWYLAFFAFPRQWREWREENEAATRVNATASALPETER